MEPVEKKQCQRVKFLIYGGSTGWIGQQLVELCKTHNYEFEIGKSRMEDRVAVANELQSLRPTHVLLAAGVTGRPTVDWCEDNKEQTIRTNVIGTLNIIDLCNLQKIHVTNFATGCIFEYDQNHPIGAKGFAEKDVPNFHGSFYSHTKAMVEDLIRNYENCLTLRIRMPISAELHERNFVTKISRYAKVVDIPNSVTVLPSLLPLALKAAIQNKTGILNFVNPGVVSHNQILMLYKNYIDPSFTWTNFSVEECESILKCKRSNNALDTTLLESMFPNVDDVHTALERVFIDMATTILVEGCNNLEKKGWLFAKH